MAEPSWLSGGSTPHRNDTIWLICARICGRIYDLYGTDPTLKPKPKDTLHRLYDKVERILASIP